MTNLLELSRIDRSIEIAAPVDRVWRALTNVDEFSSWFRVTVEGEIAAGRTITMTSTLPNYAGMRFDAEIVELTRPTRMVWRWHPGELDHAIDYSREPKTTVTFTLRPTKNGTQLDVSETGFDAISLERRAKVFKDNSQGWEEVVGWIKDHVEASN